VLAVADTAMERALRVISVERGFDPRDFALVAFGGAGALHAAELAGRLGVAEALIPPDPGLLSAYGILTAAPTREASRTLLLDAGSAGALGAVEEALDQLSSQALNALVEEDHVDPEDANVDRWVDARYRGQSFELRVPVRAAGSGPRVGGGLPSIPRGPLRVRSKRRRRGGGDGPGHRPSPWARRGRAATSGGRGAGRHCAGNDSTPGRMGGVPSDLAEGSPTGP
jgi:hypothetical protein